MELKELVVKVKIASDVMSLLRYYRDIELPTVDDIERSADKSIEALKKYENGKDTVHLIGRILFEALCKKLPSVGSGTFELKFIGDKDA